MAGDGNGLDFALLPFAPRPSPMVDFGTTWRTTSMWIPVFGTLEDFDELLRRAHGLGLRVIWTLYLTTPRTNTLGL